mgnify:FL=1
MIARIVSILVSRKKTLLELEKKRKAERKRRKVKRQSLARKLNTRKKEKPDKS